MAKLNKYKIVNFRYGEKKERLMCQDTVEFFGENTQIEATNSLGKTTTIQTILQSINPLMDIGGRKAVDLYTQTEPMFSVTEWILNDNVSKLITGVALRRKAGKDNVGKLGLYDLFSFTIFNGVDDEYIDIDDLNILYEDDDRTKCLTLSQLEEKLNSFKNLYPNRVNIFKKQRRKEYKDFIYKFGFDVNETCNILAELNVEENSLTNFLNNCKTVDALIKNKLIPIIDEKLINSNTGVKRIDELKENVANLYNAFKENQSLLTEYKDYSVFAEKLEVLNDLCTNLLDKKRIVEDDKLNLAYALNVLSDEIENLVDEISKKDKENIELKEKINQFEYLEDCVDYTGKLNKLNEVRSSLASKEENLNNQTTELKQVKNKLYELDIEDLKDEQTELMAEESKLSAKIEKAKMKETEISQKINNLGYSLNCKYTETLKQKSKELNDFKKKKSEIEKELNTKNNEYNKNFKEQEVLKAFKVKNETSISYLNKRVEEIETVLKNKNLEIVTSSELEEEIKEIEEECAGIVEKIKDLKKSSNDFDSETLELKGKVQDLEKDLIKIENKLEILINKKNEFNKIKNTIEEVQLDEISLDSPNLKENIEKYINKFEEEVSNLIVKENTIKNLLETLNSNKGINLDKELIEELRKHDIDPISGLEYILNVDMSDDEKSDLLNKNPLLTYSIIITRREYNNLVKVKLNTILENVIPVLVREDLLEDDNSLNQNNIVSYDKLNILSNFNKALINKEEIENLINLKHKELEDLKDLRNKNKKQVNNLISLKKIALDDDFSLEKESELELEKQSMEETNNKYKKEISKLEARRNDIIKEISDLNENLNNLKSKKTELGAIINSLSEKEQLRGDLQSLSTELRDVEKQISNKEIELLNLKNNIDKDTLYKDDLIANISKKEIVFNNLNKESELYKSYSVGELIDNEIDILKAEFDEFRKNGVLDELSELNDRLVKVKKDIDKNKGKIEEINKEIDTTVSTLNTVSDREILKKQRKSLSSNIKALEKDIRKLEKEESKNETLVEEKKKDVLKKYNKEAIECYEKQVFKTIIANLKEEIVENNKIIEKLKKEKDDFEKVLLKNEDYIIRNLHIKSSLVIKKEDVVDVIKSLLDNFNKNIKLYNKISEEIDEKKTEVISFVSNNQHISFAKERIKSVKSNLTFKDTIISILDSINKLKDKLEADKDNLENEKNTIIGFIKDFCKEVFRSFEELNSSARLNGEQLFKIHLPNEDKINYDHIADIVENSIKSDNENTAISRINTYTLINNLVNISSLKVEVMKFELSGKKHKINWKDINKFSSGGQVFCIAFILLSVVMDFKTSELRIEFKNVSKFLLLDNPFGKISEASFLEQVFELSKKFDIQIISLTHLQNLSIRKQFNRIYRMDIRKTVSGKEYVTIDTIKESVKISDFLVGKKETSLDLFSIN